jgi:hypothetical protein
MERHNVLFREIMAHRSMRKEMGNSWVERQVNLFYPYIEGKALIEETGNTQSNYSSNSPGFNSRISHAVIKNFAHVFLSFLMLICTLDLIKCRWKLYNFCTCVNRDWGIGQLSIWQIIKTPGQWWGTIDKNRDVLKEQVYVSCGWQDELGNFWSLSVSKLMNFFHLGIVDILRFDSLGTLKSRGDNAWLSGVHINRCMVARCTH